MMVALRGSMLRIFAARARLRFAPACGPGETEPYGYLLSASRRVAQKVSIVTVICSALRAALPAAAVIVSKRYPGMNLKSPESLS